MAIVYVFILFLLVIVVIILLTNESLIATRRKKQNKLYKQDDPEEHYVSLLFFSEVNPYTQLPKRKKKVPWYKTKNILVRAVTNPIIGPNEENEWESWQTFNPAAVYHQDKVHFLYRALGPDGVSRLGYATSSDGIHIEERIKDPVFSITTTLEPKTRNYMRDRPFASGGGWAGCEDPRITILEDKLYLLFVAFDKIGLPRIAITSLRMQDFLARRWKWGGAKIISPPGVIDKSGVLFPEKINGKYVIMHRIFPNILIDFLDDLDFKKQRYLEGGHSINVRLDNWDSRKIGAGAPPIKTKYGWLLIYYAVDNKDDTRYKIGAMLLDLKDPRKVLHRTSKPILEPDYWYENRGHKAGVAYPCGAAVIKGKLFVYYGGADSYVCVASTSFKGMLEKLRRDQPIKLKKVFKKMKK
jgi:beta-1,2-mannobiose phosphorylase / 1,2-beta-oligomannan phosphorylase